MRTPIGTSCHFAYAADAPLLLLCDISPVSAGESTPKEEARFVLLSRIVLRFIGEIYPEEESKTILKPVYLYFYLHKIIRIVYNAIVVRYALIIAIPQVGITRRIDEAGGVKSGDNKKFVAKSVGVFGSR